MKTGPVLKRMKLRAAVLGLVTVALLAAACSDDSTDESPGDTEPQQVLGGDELRINEIQMLGSHNSYHVPAIPEVAAALEALVPDLWAEINYEHLPLTEQLEDYGIRQFELDVVADPEGGLFSTPAGLEVLGIEADEPAEMDEPGFKVQHIADVDYVSTCLTLVACLGEIEAWSAENPSHFPMMIMVETKADDLVSGADGFGVDLSDLDAEFVTPFEMTPELYEDLEAEVLSVFNESRIITPDDVRGDHDSLEDAVLEDGWPMIGSARGKVMFSLVDTGDAREVYVEDAPSLEGRLFFTSSEPGRPDAAFLRYDDPTEEPGKLDELAGEGYLIRTRTDSPGVHAPANDTSWRDAALVSGAHYLSTDQYQPFEGTGFVVELPGGAVAVCNPITAPTSCNTEDLEE